MVSRAALLLLLGALGGCDSQTDEHAGVGVPSRTPDAAVCGSACADAANVHGLMPPVSPPERSDAAPAHPPPRKDTSTEAGVPHRRGSAEAGVPHRDAAMESGAPPT